LAPQMLENLADKIRNCYRHARDCERSAKAQSDPSSRKDFLDTAEHWIRLEHSYELTDQLLRFLPKR
jgi:hypothetical protein